MIIRARSTSDTQRRRSLEQRIHVLQGILIFVCLIIIGRLIELQVVKGAEYHRRAQEQQYGGVVLSAKRGEVLSRNSKTEETSILATSTTLDLLYIDPVVISTDHAEVADALANILVTTRFDALCRQGNPACPTELLPYYRDAFDPLRKPVIFLSGGTGALVPDMQGSGAVVLSQPSPVSIPDIGEIRRLFARYVEKRIKEQTVTFVPLLYGANKKQVADTAALAIGGIEVDADQSLIYADPDAVDQDELSEIARMLSPIIRLDPGIIQSRLVRRKLRYVPVMSRLTPDLSQAVNKLKEVQDTIAREQTAKLRTASKRGTVIAVEDPYRAIALIPQHWRVYPDTRIASHIIGFINAQGDPQYGIERSYDSVLRGQEGLISSVSDPFGGQIVSSNQKFIDPRDGSTVVLTIDRFVQSRVEELLAAMVKQVDAESGQVIILDPATGKIIAMANAPLFDNNTYASVYEKEPMYIDPEREKQLVVEIWNPEHNTRVLKDYLTNLLPAGRQLMSDELKADLTALEQLYDLRSISRYFLYMGENNRREIFPTDRKGIWLKYKNNIGVGSYVNRTVQEVYEPGSVMKPITMAIAIDQGEVTPTDVYFDTGALKVDNFPIRNALGTYYGKVTMVDCIDFSINTCMTSVSRKLGRQLFQAGLTQFGFGRITGIELDNELPGNLKPVREWSSALLMTMAFGQGITTTPLQMVTAFGAIANGGKLMRPTIIDEIRHPDGTVDRKQPVVVSQLLKPETTATMTAMLTHSAQFGFAKAGKVKGHRIAGKTGTSQIAGPGGKYETGTGSTIATYAGYAPVDHPKFVILVKLDRPKKDDFGSKSAAPLFKDIAAFLFDYYNIPPDEK
ncbi:MAG: penicillin-binding protein 2 [Candidatus Peribacteraceae bacterium]|nr:penicillin-binding protein 2 [Candidatus Peribacteraceae bacterium]